MIIDKIKTMRMAAMRSGEKERKNVLTTLLGTIETEEKRGNTVDDVVVIATIKKFVINAKDNYEITKDEVFLREVSVYDELLPSQLSEDELAVVIDTIISEADNPNMGFIMKTLKEKHGGLYDGKMASVIVKEKLK